MVRAIWFLVILGALAAVAVWLADRPGSVTLRWQGYRLDTSVAVLLGVVAVVAAAAAALYRLWIFFRQLPARLGRARRERRRRRGYIALTRGMVAVAAGDAEEARRQAKRAEFLLGDPPLTLLLSAQAAQLAGDEGAAESFFTAMLERPETEFLGVRGLLTQGIKRGDGAGALRLARRAYRLKPRSEWVTANLFELQVRAGHWLDAQITLDERVKRKLVTSAEGRRRRAVLYHQRSLEAEAAAEGADRRHLARQAHRQDPGLVPAAARLAGLLVAAGKPGKAARVIETTWPHAPHPALIAAHGATRPTANAVETMRAVELLTRNNPDHPESHLAVAAAALRARLWGEARRHLEAAAAGNPSARICRLMAEVEESERGDSAAAREWLLRASRADPDPAWVCERCANVVAEWTALCPQCRSFDTLVWRTPPRVVALAEPAAAAALPAATAAALAEAEGRPD